MSICCADIILLNRHSAYCTNRTQNAPRNAVEHLGSDLTPLHAFERWVAGEGKDAFDLMLSVNHLPSAQDKLYALWMRFRIEKR